MTTRPVALCLACSSSPSPKASSAAPFTTACCSRPICESCLTKNPRLRGYNPCLACLAGVAVVDKSRALTAKSNEHGVHVTSPGPTGRSEDQEEGMFVLGDSDEDEDGLETNARVAPEAPPAYAEEPEMTSTVADDETLVGDTASEVTPEAEGSHPTRYYIQPGDTLRGLALKYGVDGRKICQLNSLPFNTLSTTPHLLHTRTSIILPPTHRPLQPPPSPEVLEARTRERAEKRFQFVTKEVDWRVAKAYVAIAEDEDDTPKDKEDAVTTRPGKQVLEAKAVDQYLDDGEWEAGQSGGPRIEGFPPFAEGKGKRPERVPLTNRLGKLIRP